MDSEKIGKFICELRKEKGLSQYQLADLIPISRQGVSKWERGVTTPDPQTLLKLSDMFNVSINELLNGERFPKTTIEETTLSILDESNKKSKKLKRISLISISIIIVLLLSFLSYYFINSYNSTEVYTISGKSDSFRTYGGLMIITKEKVYMKLGKLKYNSEIEIKNIKLFYKKNNKNKLIVEDTDIDNIVIKDSYGYKEKIKDKKINNLYLEITYNDNNKEIIKLKPRKDYINDNLFFQNQQNSVKNKNVQDILKKEEKNEENKEETKEEVKPVVQETQEVKKQEPQKPKQEVKEEPKVELKTEPPKEPEITTDQVLSKIKEKCLEDMGTYMCEYSNGLIIYYQETNIIEILENDESIGEYNIKENRYVCVKENCKDKFNNIFKVALFS